MIIERGSRVSVSYEGTFEDGTVFDSSSHGDHSHPLTFVVGEGRVIEGFEKAVIGMKKGEEKKFEVAPEEAYGLLDERLMREVPRKSLPPDPEPVPGMTLAITTPDGKQIPVSISEVKKDTVVLNFNHPLAGKKLFFTITIVRINEDIP